VRALWTRGHRVRALVRRGSQRKAPAGCEIMAGDPFDRSTFAHTIGAGDGHFVYVSVARPAPMMQEYQQVRGKAERALDLSGLRRTIVRPWYVLGPGHRWPYALLPMCWILERVPSTRASAQRLGLVTIGEMVTTLVHAVEHPPRRARIVEVPDIRATAHLTAKARRILRVLRVFVACCR
jgi:uncharacterized protein YbjT (DUF2867 family)